MTLAADRIAMSWQRASMNGLDPAWLPTAVHVSPVTSSSRLLDAARPVMDRLATIFAGIDCSVILADRNVRLVDIRHGTNGIDDALTENGAVPGRLFTEETSGTNSISTVRELREPLAVRGNQHFFEAMKMFSCYGFPILHPVNGRIEGVITLTFYTAVDSPLLHNMVMQGSDEIARRLARQQSRGDHQLLDAFHDAAVLGGTAPVIAISPSIVIANSAAVDKLDAVDLLSLRARDPLIADDIPHQFNSGGQTDTVSRRLGNAVIVELARESTLASATLSRSRIDRVADQLSNSRRDGTSFAVAGEPGTGRSTILADLMKGHDPILFDALDSILQSEKQWLHTVIASLDSADRPVAVDNVHLLSPQIAHALHKAVERSVVWFAVSSEPLISLSPDAFRLVDGCRTRVELLPLRLRKHEIPVLVDGLLAEIGSPIRFTPAALRALIGHEWPGNLTELRAEVLAAARLRSAGDVTDRDLGRLRERTATPRLGAIDSALRTVIEDELARHGGNKLAVAKTLNISRTTLYKKMRPFGIDG
ncbi:MAG: helix-turn-helix domain-containing protein [Rhodococcus sp. (in: high G+C Gram-positive bacteria)]